MPLLPRGQGSGGGDADCPFPGGYPGQVLTKKSEDDCDVAWKDPAPSQLYYRGAYDTPEDLYAARPVDIPGAYAVVFSTNTFFIWSAETNFWKNTGNAIVEGGIEEAPIDGATYGRKNAGWTPLADDAPYKPQGLSPTEGSVNVPVYLRLKLSAYAHPHNVPIGGSHWQVSRNAAFTDLVFDRVQMTASSSIIVTTDDQAQPWLPVSTLLYWRARYIDLKDVESRWSDPLSFTTEATVSAQYILAPDILYPADEGWMPDDGRLVVQLSNPVGVNVTVIDRADLDVNISPNFEPAGSLASIADFEDSRLITDDSVDLTTAPSPIYMRARQKSSVDGVVSPYSSVPTVWLQRAFKDVVVGRETIIRLDETMTLASFSRWIDRHRKPVNVPVEYWNDSAICGAMQPQKFQSADGNPDLHDMVFVPPFYVRGETVEENGYRLHRVWVSPVEFEGCVICPPFVRAPRGFLVGAALMSNGANGWGSFLNVPGTPTSPANVLAVSATLGSNVRALSFHDRAALNLLAGIEFCTWNPAAVSAGSGVANNDTSRKYRGIYGVSNTGTNLIAIGTRLKTNILHVGLPNNPESLVPISTITIPTDSYGRTSVSRILTGHSVELNAPYEMYGLPLVSSSGFNYKERYYMCNSGKDNGADHLGSDNPNTGYPSNADTTSLGYTVWNNGGANGYGRFIVIQ